MGRVQSGIAAHSETVLRHPLAANGTRQNVDAHVSLHAGGRNDGVSLDLVLAINLSLTLLSAGERAFRPLAYLCRAFGTRPKYTRGGFVTHQHHVFLY